MKLIMRLPSLPSKVLGPNWKPFTVKSKWVLKEARDEIKANVYFLVLQALGDAGIEVRPAFKSITITYIFICPVKRSRDGDNWIGRMKAAQDGLVMAGVVADDTHDMVTVLPPVFIIEKGRSETIIEIEGEL